MGRSTCLWLSLTLCLAMGSAQGAKYAGDPFSLGVGARPLALGGAVVAGPFDGSAAYWNPAGMNLLEGRSIIAMHAETFGSLLNHDYVSYIDARTREGAVVRGFGFYAYYLGGGGIKITELNQYNRPVILREESHADLLLAAAISGRIRSKLDFGITAKIIYRDLGTESGMGLTADAGLLYQAKPFARLGLMVTDITTGFIRYSGKTFNEGGHAESIYPTVKPGLMLEHNWRQFTGRFMASGDIKFEGLKTSAQYWTGAISLDTHYGWELAYKEMLFGRAGFDIGRLTAGAGLDIRHITIDFAYLHQADLDETFRVSAGYRF